MLKILIQHLVDPSRNICLYKGLSHANVRMKYSSYLICEQLIIKVIIYLNVGTLNSSKFMWITVGKLEIIHAKRGNLSNRESLY